ncbi:hypothetical protein SpCBS45565_g02633 [Spizellomyces sp. 'palustris']|nr:hypothetical protein SpCBS45565_g02633 [Spizellomyces sp. 'palustris']
MRAIIFNRPSGRSRWSTILLLMLCATFLFLHDHTRRKAAKVLPEWVRKGISTELSEFIKTADINIQCSHQLEQPATIEPNRKVQSDLPEFGQWRSENALRLGMSQCDAHVTYQQNLLYDFYGYRFANITHVGVIGQTIIANPGDAALYTATVSMLQKLHIHIVYACPFRECSVDEMQKALDEAQPDKRRQGIVFNGGGNMKSQSFIAQKVRNTFVEAFPEVQITHMPQSVWFDDLKHDELTREIYKRHNDVVVTVRDRLSFERIKHWTNEGIPVYLLPDTAHIHGVRADYMGDVKYDFLIVPRNDNENGVSHHQVEAFETLVRGDGMQAAKMLIGDWNDQPFEKIIPLQEKDRTQQAWLRYRFGMEWLAQGELIVTDRLHSTIVGLSLGKQVIVMEQGPYKKIQGFYETWYKPGCDDLVRFADGVEDAVKLAMEWYKNGKSFPASKAQSNRELLPMVSNTLSEPKHKSPKYAMTTVLTGDRYLAGALVLGFSISQVPSLRNIDRIALVPKDAALSDTHVKMLRKVGWTLLYVDRVPMPAKVNWKFEDMLIKLHTFKMTQYEMIAAIDSDAFVVGDFLPAFELLSVSGAPLAATMAATKPVAPFWDLMAGHFNAGTVFLRTNATAYEILHALSQNKEYYPTDLAEQSLLNRYYAGQWLGLPATYNLLFAYSARREYYHEIRPQTKIVHFAGRYKPWLPCTDKNTHSCGYDSHPDVLLWRRWFKELVRDMGWNERDFLGDRRSDAIPDFVWEDLML